MVNNAFTPAEQAAAERRMVLAYAPARSRAGLAALLALDDTLGAIPRGTRDPMIGQMRFTWWHDALSALDDLAPPAEPVLRALASDVLPRVGGARLANMIEGWEELLDPDPLDEGRLTRYANGRGARLFAAAATLVEAPPTDALVAAGRGWALADLAAHIRDPSARDLAASLARASLADARRISRPARALGAMAHLAAMPDAPPPRRVARALWHRLTGR